MSKNHFKNITKHQGFIKDFVALSPVHFLHQKILQHSLCCFCLSGLKSRLSLVNQGQPLTKYVSRTIAEELKENSIKVDEGTKYNLNCNSNNDSNLGKKFSSNVASIRENEHLTLLTLHLHISTLFL